MRFTFLKNLFKPRRCRAPAAFIPTEPTPFYPEHPDYGTVFCSPQPGLIEAGAVVPTQKQWLYEAPACAASAPFVGGPEGGQRHVVTDRHIAARPRPQRPLTRPPEDILVIDTPRLRSSTAHTRPEACALISNASALTFNPSAPIAARSRPQRPLTRPPSDILVIDTPRLRSITAHARPEAPAASNPPAPSTPPAPPVPSAAPVPRTSRRHRAPTPPIDPNFLAPPGGHPRRRRLPTSSPVSEFPIQGWAAAPTAHDHSHPPAAEPDSPELTIQDRHRRLAVLYGEIEHLMATGPHPVAGGIAPVMPHKAAAKSGIASVTPNEAAARSGGSQPVFSTAPLVPRRTRPAPAGKIPEVGPFMNTEMAEGDWLRHGRPSERGSNGENMPDQATRAALRSRHRAQIDHRLVGLGVYSASNDLAAHAYPTCI